MILSGLGSIQVALVSSVIDLRDTGLTWLAASVSHANHLYQVRVIVCLCAETNGFKLEIQLVLISSKRTCQPTQVQGKVNIMSLLHIIESGVFGGSEEAPVGHCASLQVAGQPKHLG